MTECYLSVICRYVTSWLVHAYLPFEKSVGSWFLAPSSDPVPVKLTVGHQTSQSLKNKAKKIEILSTSVPVYVIMAYSIQSELLTFCSKCLKVFVNQVITQSTLAKRIHSSLPSSINQESSGLTSNCHPHILQYSEANCINEPSASFWFAEWVCW